MRERTVLGTFKESEARKKARASGEKYYQGKDCLKLHGGMRFVSNNGCMECLKIQCREYYNRHKESEKKRNRKYKEKNKEKNAIQSNQWAKDNPEKIKDMRKKYYDNNKEMAKEKTKKWQQLNPDKKIAAEQQRRALKKKSRGKITAQEWTLLKAKYYYTCLCCRKKEPEIKITMDHVIPLFKGGPHIIENIQPLCWSCNCKKRTQTTDYREIYEILG